MLPARENIYSESGSFSRAGLSLLVKEFHKHSSHWYSMEVRTADVVHRKEFARPAPLPDCGRRAARGVLSRFPEVASR